jgi:hypothetical protein
MEGAEDAKLHNAPKGVLRRVAPWGRGSCLLRQLLAVKMAGPLCSIGKGDKDADRLMESPKDGCHLCRI